MKIKILPLGVMGGNERRYSLSDFEKFAQTYRGSVMEGSDKFLPIYIAEGNQNLFNSIVSPVMVGWVKAFTVEEEVLVAEVHFIGQLTSTLWETGYYAMRPCGEGEIGPEGWVHDYTMKFLSMFPIQYDVWGGIK